MAMPIDASPWLTLTSAAKHLDTNYEALRKRCQRGAKRIKGGVIEATLSPGIRARKIGRDWHVQFSLGWGAPENDLTEVYAMTEDLLT